MRKRKQKRHIDLISHFKRIIFRDLKPLQYLLLEETKYLGSFTSFWPHIFNFTFSSIANKITLLNRLTDPEKIQKDITNKILETLLSMENVIKDSLAPPELKARSTACLAVANLMLDNYEKTLDLAKLTTKYIDAIKFPVRRSTAIRDVLYFIGNISRYSKRDQIDIPDEILNELSTLLSQAVEKNIVEANLVQDPYKRALIYTNLGFGSRMFHTVVKIGVQAEWFDINQAQRLALDALNEIKRIDDWYKRSIIMADAATVLAISGEDTVGLAREKFDEATEISFKKIDDDPLRAAYVLGRIAYDKAYTRFYLDSDKYFFESIAILLEADDLERTMPIIFKILKLAGKVRYFYVIYEVIRDWLLPLVDKVPDVILRARFLSVISHLAIPVSTNWAISIARESLSHIRNIIDYEFIPIYDDYSFMDRPLRHALTLLDLLPTLINTSYAIPQDTSSLMDHIISIIVRLTNLYTQDIPKRHKRITNDDLLTFMRKMGRIIAILRSAPRISKHLTKHMMEFLLRLKRAYSLILGNDSIYLSLPSLNFIYGLSLIRSDLATELLLEEIKNIFSYEKNTWILRDSEFLSKLANNKSLLEQFADILRLIVEVGFRINKNVRTITIDLLIDLSEQMEHHVYTRLLTRLLEKIRDQQIAKSILINIFNVLIDEEKISKKDLPRKFYRIVRNIDPVYAKFIMEELG